MLVTIKEAALVLGYKSPGSLYRKIDSKELPVVERDGQRMIERDGLEDLWRSINRNRLDTPKAASRKARQVPPAVADRVVSSVDDDGDDDEIPDYNESRARSEYEKANLLELNRKKEEGQLLRREDVEQAWASAVNITRTKMLGVPSRAKQQIPHLTPDEVELIRDLIREALDELAAGEVTA